MRSSTMTYILLGLLAILIAIAVAGFFRTRAMNRDRERLEEERRTTKQRLEQLERNANSPKR